MPANQKTMSLEKMPTCRCGHNRSHHMVSEEAEYSWFDWILVTVIGTTCVPKKIKFQCRKCQEVFDETTDPDALRRNI